MGHPAIRPNGINQGDLVNLLYSYLASFYGVCVKLDADTGVTDTNYTALCYTALFTTVTVRNKNGSEIGLNRVYEISPNGVSDAPLIELMYQISNAMEVLTTKLDAEGLTDSDYESLCYTAKFLHRVINKTGSSTGLATSTTFRAGGISQRELVNWLYNMVDAWETLLEKLDADGTVNGTNYEALWFTATIITNVMDCQGNIIGNG